jgi:hypothetical protein
VLVGLAPSEIVVVVHFFQDLRAQNAGNALAYPVASRVCIVSCQVHAFDVLRAKIGGRRNHARFNVHAVSGPAFFEEPRRDFVAKSAGAEMYADPDPVLLVGEQIDVVISGTHCA